MLGALAFFRLRRRKPSASGAAPGGLAQPSDAAFVPQRSARAESVDLSDVVSRLRDPLRRGLPADIRLVVEPGTRLPAARADRSQLELIVAHLVLAARATMPDGGTVTIRTAAHGGGAAGEDDGVALEVEASGTIDRVLLPRLFEPLSEGGAADGDALRLELASAHALASHNRGTLRVEPLAAGGTRFVVVLPPMRQEPVDRSTLAARGRETVLVVEDENAVRMVVRRTLQTGGYHILEASDPLIALDILEKGEEHVDLLLSDILMQHMRGTELVRRVRERWPLVRVLYMSGYGHDPAVIQEVARDGAVLVPKPFTPDELLTAVRGALDSLPGPQDNGS